MGSSCSDRSAAGGGCAAGTRTGGSGPGRHAGTGPRGRHLDSITLTRPAAHLRDMFSGKIQRGASAIPPAVILRILSLAVELAS